MSKPTPGSGSFGRALARPPLARPEAGVAEVFGRRRGFTLEFAAVAPTAVSFAVVVGDAPTAAWRVRGWSAVVVAAGRACGLDGAFVARVLRARCFARGCTPFAGVCEARPDADAPGPASAAGAAAALDVPAAAATGSAPGPFAVACGLAAPGELGGADPSVETVGVVTWPTTIAGGTLTTGGLGVVGVGVVAVTLGVVAVTVGVLAPPPAGGCGRGLVGTVTVTDGNVIVKVGLVTATGGVVSTMPPAPGAGVVTGVVAAGSVDTAPATVVVTALTAPAAKADPAHPPTARSAIRPAGTRAPRKPMLVVCHGVPLLRGDR